MVTAKIQRAWTLNVGSRPTRLRLAHLLCELHARCAHVGLVDKANRFALPLTQADLGSACAMTAIHTNRPLQDLRRDGLIESDGRTMTILDHGPWSTWLASMRCTLLDELIELDQTLASSPPTDAG